MNRARVVITGAGAVTAAGPGEQRFWDCAVAGTSCLKQAVYETKLSRSNMAGSMPEYDVREYIRRRSIRTLDRITRHTLVTSALALQDASIDPDEIDGPSAGVVIGHNFGVIRSTAEFHEDLVVSGPRMLNPNVFPNTATNSAPSQVGIEWGLRGISNTIITGLSSSGIDALGAAMNAIQFGHARIIIAGGLDELCSKLHIALDRLNFLSRDGRGGQDAIEGIRPFDIRRNGTVLGEGVVLFVLETRQEALERGARVRAEILGYGTYSGKGTKKQPSIVAAITRALKNARVKPEEIDLIVAEGCGWALSDRREAEAIHQVFGAFRPPVTAVKGITGFTLGASSAVNVLTAILSMEAGVIPPVANLTVLDPACECNQVRKPLYRETATALVLSGSDMVHSALVVRSPREGEGDGQGRTRL